MLNRRRFALLGGSTLAMPYVPSAAAAAPRRLRLAFGSSLDNPFGAAALLLAQRVAEATNGRLKVDIYPEATLGNDEAALSALVAGALDLAIISAALVADYAPEVGLLDLPFLFADAASAQAALDGPEGQDLADIATARGVAVLAWGESGFRHLTANRPLRTAAALRGMKLRVLHSPLLIRAFQASGADVEALAFSQLYEALLTGQFEAQENPLQLVRSARLYEVQSHVMLTRHSYSTMAITASTDLMADLAAPDRAVLIAAAKSAAQRSREVVSQTRGQTTQALQAHGMTVVSDVDRTSFLAAMAPAEAEAAERFGADRIARLRRV